MPVEVVRRADPRQWSVPSRRGLPPWIVSLDPEDNRLHCECEGYSYSGMCHHVLKVQWFEADRYEARRHRLTG